MSERMEMSGGGNFCFWEENGRVFFRCEREADCSGLYKVWVCGAGGEFLLGTLVPDGDTLVLNRAVWLVELRRAGCWPVRGANCRLAYSFPKPQQQTQWYWEEHPQHLVDTETARVGEWGRMLVCREGDELRLAFPLKLSRALPLSALICLASPGNIAGDLCLIWRFDRQGRPLLPRTIEV